MRFTVIMPPSTHTHTHTHTHTQRQGGAGLIIALGPGYVTSNGATVLSEA